MNDCIFCKIIEGKIPAEIVYRDSDMVAFADIHPKARVHLLLVPFIHLASLNDATHHSELLGKLMSRAVLIAKQAGIDKSGYRVLVNTGDDSGQVVHHLHIHIMGGERL
jgi:histidine triad (HIT) family protein